MEKKNIAIISPLTSYSGYGQYGRNISNTLIHSYGGQQGYEIFLFNSDNQYSFDGQKLDLQNSKYRGLIDYIKPLQDIQKQFFDVLINVCVPQAFIQKGLVNIGVTALAEVDKVHPQLIQHCNRMDEVWVMSEYNVETLKASQYNIPDNTGGVRSIKINVPVGIMPHAYIDGGEPMGVTEVSKFIDTITQPNLIMTMGQWLPGSIGNDRKDIGSLIATFLKAFGPTNKEVGLLLKVDQGRSSIISEYGMRQRMNEIARGLGIQEQIQNVYFISGNLSQNQVNEIYSHKKVKAYVSFTHGQSFGIPIMEFSATTGKPLVIPYHSGLCDYIRPEYCHVITHKEKQVPQELFQTFYRDFLIPESKWFVIDYQHGAYLMAQTLKDKSDKAKKQQEHIKELLSVEQVSKVMKQLLSRYLTHQETL